MVRSARGGVVDALRFASNIVAELPQIQYLNTDLDLVAPTSLALLIAHLESCGVSPLQPTLGDDSNWYVTFETDDTFVEPCSNIAAMLTAIESAVGDAQQCWNTCTKREFNVGYDCGDEPWSFNQGLSNDTLRRIAASGATLRVTLYPLRNAKVVTAGGDSDP